AAAEETRGNATRKVDAVDDVRACNTRRAQERERRAQEANATPKSLIFPASQHITLNAHPRLLQTRLGLRRSPARAIPTETYASTRCCGFSSWGIGGECGGNSPTRT